MNGNEVGVVSEEGGGRECGERRTTCCWHPQGSYQGQECELIDALTLGRNLLKQMMVVSRSGTNNIIIFTFVASSAVVVRCR